MKGGSQTRNPKLRTPNLTPKPQTQILISPQASVRGFQLHLSVLEVSITRGLKNTVFLIAQAPPVGLVVVGSRFEAQHCKHSTPPHRI